MQNASAITLTLTRGMFKLRGSLQIMIHNNDRIKLLRREDMQNNVYTYPTLETEAPLIPVNIFSDGGEEQERALVGYLPAYITQASLNYLNYRHPSTERLVYMFRRSVSILIYYFELKNSPLKYKSPKPYLLFPKRLYLNGRKVQLSIWQCFQQIQYVFHKT